MKKKQAKIKSVKHRVPHTRKPAAMTDAAWQMALRKQIAEDEHFTIKKNGDAIVLGADGLFEVPMFLHPGINVVQIEAKNAAGRTRTITRNLLMPRQ